MGRVQVVVFKRGPLVVGPDTTELCQVLWGARHDVNRAAALLGHCHIRGERKRASTYRAKEERRSGNRKEKKQRKEKKKERKGKENDNIVLTGVRHGPEIFELGTLIPVNSLNLWSNSSRAYLLERP